MERIGLSDLLDEEIRTSTLYQAAITHRSAGASHNERLEYLGDAVLGLVIAEKLYLCYPQATEGDLSRLRAYLVRRRMLAEVAREIRLGETLILGQGERRSGGSHRDSTLANALEAVFGAVYLLKGMAAVRTLIFNLFKSRLDNLPALEELKDPKSKLQEILQSRNLPLPEYVLLRAEGSPHAHLFRLRCLVKPFNIDVVGEGPSKRAAEQQSAKLALEMMDLSGDSES